MTANAVKPTAAVVDPELVSSSYPQQRFFAALLGSVSGGLLSGGLRELTGPQKSGSLQTKAVRSSGVALEYLPCSEGPGGCYAVRLVATTRRMHHPTF